MEFSRFWGLLKKRREDKKKYLDLVMTMVFIILQSNTVHGYSETVIHGPTEYCQAETFNPECGEQEVLVMVTARYGRIHVGRCLSPEYGDFGCEYDVLRDLDLLCSGKRSCKVKVDEASIAGARSCHKDLKSMLVASYKCIPVTSAGEFCDVSQIKVTGRSEGYISNIEPNQTECGKGDVRPWVIEVKPGQTINLTLYDFMRNETDGFPLVCKVYATVREDKKPGATTICGSVERIWKAYLSTSNKVEIRLIAGAQTKKLRFLLHYKAIGCPDIPAADDMKVERNADMTSITCANTGATWRLTCKEKDGVYDWEGIAPANCSKQGIALATQNMNYEQMPYALSIAIIVAIAFLVSCLIFVIGVFCIRNRIKRRSPANLHVSQTETPDYYDVPPFKDSYPKAPSTPLGSGAPGKENEYATMRLLRSACFNREKGPQGGHPQDCSTISSTYDPRRRGFMEHTYESPEVIRKEGSPFEGTITPQYFDLMKKNQPTFGGGPVSPQYFDLDLPTYPLEVKAHAHGHQDRTLEQSPHCFRQASLGPNAEKRETEHPNKYSL